jgi:alpha-glucosidase
MRGGDEWWRGAVIYQIYPRSFQDSNGDGVGDLRGITSRLDYVASLGVDSIWLSPFLASPQDDFGYDVSDYRAVDPLFGTLADFDELLAEAHARGLKIIMDQVISHTSDRHAWFVESRQSRENERADWYVWVDPKPDGTPPNNWLSVFGGPAWQWEPRRQQYYLHNFLVSQPDLNLHNPVVLDAVLGELGFWLDRGVDGFRLDTANFYLHDPLLRDNPPRPAAERGGGSVPLSNPYSWQLHVYDRSRPENLAVLRRLRRLTDGYPDRMMVGEIACDLGVRRIAEYCAAPDLLHTGYSFDLLGSEFSAAHIRRAVELFFAEPGEGWPAWALSNHDVTRVVTRWGGNNAPPALAKLLIALVCCLPGTPFLYQGEELGLPQAELAFADLRDPYGIAFWPEYRGRDGCRTPIPWDVSSPAAGFSSAKPWLPVPDSHRALTVAAQEGDPNSPLCFTRAFLRWRRGQPALLRGSFEFLDAPEPILAIVRQAPSDHLLCAFNLGAVPVVWTVPHDLSDETSPLALGGSTDASVGRLPPYGAVFARLRSLS